MAEVITYRARPGSRLSDKDAEIVGPELRRIAEQHGDAFQPADVVEDARPKDSALHPYFEWDDRAAASQHRIQQARNLVGAVELHIVVQPLDSPPISTQVRLIHHVSAPQNDGGVEPRYVTIDTVRQKPDYAMQVVTNANRELVAWANRYRDYRNLLGFPTHLREVIDRVDASTSQLPIMDQPQAAD